MNRTCKSSIAALMLSGLLIQASYAQEVTLESDADKGSYGLGWLVGERILNQYQNLDLDLDLIIQGMKAQQAGDEPAVDPTEAEGALQMLQQAAAAEISAVASQKGLAYLEENKAKEGVQVTESGLQYEVIAAAEGPKPTVDDTVTVHYVGTLIDGTEFDSSIARGQPASFPLKGVIPGWTEGLQLMNVGSKFRFVIPSELAYGERGAGAATGPGETLIFNVELLEIK